MAVEEAHFKLEKLTVENYHGWKFSVKMYLIGKDLWDIVQGTEVLAEDANEDDKKKFRKRDNLALASICLAVSTNLQIYVRNTKTSKEAWDNLSNHFEEKTLSKKIYYRRMLYSARMGKGTNMVSHVNNIKTIAEHLEAVEDPVLEKDLVMILISSLPDEYNNLITALETLAEDKLNWTYVRDRVIHEYERKKGGNGKEIPQVQDALFIKQQHKKFNKNHGRNNYNNNRNPDNNNNNRNYDISKYSCHHCHQKGHFQRDCPKKFEKKKPFANAVVHEDKHKENFTPEFALQVGDDEKGDDWWLDSGCSQHMTSEKSDLVNYKEFRSPMEVILADRSAVLSYGSGDVNIRIFNGEEAVDILFINVLYVPKLVKRLISISQVTNKGAEVKFTGNSCILVNCSKQYLFGHKHGKLWKLNSSPEASCCLSYTSKKDSLFLWHLRYGHLNHSDVRKLKTENMVSGMKLNLKDRMDEHCEGCALGKQSRYPFPKKSLSKTSEILELVHSDVCGPMNIPSVGGSVYFITFIDDFSKFVTVYMMKKKNEAFNKFDEYVKMAENLTGKRLKRIRSDHGGEYI